MWTLRHSPMFKTYVHQMLIPWRGCPSYLLWHESQVVVSSVSVIPCNQVDNSCCPTGITRLPGAGLDVAIGPVSQHPVAFTFIDTLNWLGMRSDVMRPSMDDLLKTTPASTACPNAIRCDIHLLWSASRISKHGLAQSWQWIVGFPIYQIMNELCLLDNNPICGMILQV